MAISACTLQCKGCLILHLSPVLCPPDPQQEKVLRAAPSLSWSFELAITPYPVLCIVARGGLKFQELTYFNGLNNEFE